MSREITPFEIARDEFTATYAERSGITVERLRESGLLARPCDCKDETCKGWKMTHPYDDALTADVLSAIEEAEAVLVS